MQSQESVLQSYTATLKVSATEKPCEVEIESKSQLAQGCIYLRCTKTLKHCQADTEASLPQLSYMIVAEGQAAGLPLYHNSTYNNPTTRGCSAVEVSQLLRLFLL